ncbi:MAG: ABC transporter ATP-binding protein [Alphaproteobacteria bacterium]
MTVLAVDRVHVGYGPIKAVRGCTLAVEKGETVAVVGANGAGKTTLMRAISGMLPLQDGTIAFLGKSTAGTECHQLARQGMLHIPEGRGTIPNITVTENLRVAYDVRPTRSGFADAASRVFDRFPRLKERADSKAGNLSGGEQQMLALARAIVNPPQLLLIDEPSLGLSPIMIAQAYAAMRDFQDDGMTILLVEQNVRAALSFAHRGYVLKQGEIVLSGTGAELLADGNLLQHYLGTP